MNYDDIFEAYYTQYRAEADVPNSTEDEYAIGIPLANEAINRWEHYDNTLWHELYSTLQLSGDGDSTIVTGQTDYIVPADFTVAGGDVIILDTDGTRLKTYPYIPPEEVQFMGDTAMYSFFTGSPAGGYTMSINPAPDSTISGKLINYLYYKKATRLSRGSSRTEMGDPYFIVHRMLANRFRASRNPYYTSAKADAEDSLRTMQLQNNSGNWANPWSLPDHSGTQFGG